ncbi:dentin sialophosphoprotein-like [Telopea speciosissima]|uniref:dentin sialophosphoprotein-like n=1 Tax=Telopea speciosissima TaxID=54955 RepID=UPI001CC6D2B5|nr:dentin sialophosphoprotein-like [Telopea speciosissima]
MGNEMGNQNVSRMQEQDSIKLEASKESVEVSMASIDVNGAEDAKQQIASGDSSGAGDPKQTINGREHDKTETQAHEGSSKVPMGSNNHNGMDGGMESVSSIDDGEFHPQTGSPSKENLPRTMDNQIQRQASSGREGEEARISSLDTKSIVGQARSMELETIKSDQHESTIDHTELSVSSSESQKTNEHTGSPSEENSWRKNENQTQIQASNGGEGEETRYPLLDSKSMVPNPQSVELETVTNQHKSTISAAESSGPLSEIGNSNEHTGSASEENSSRINDNQVQREASFGEDWEETRTSCLDTKSRVQNPESMILETLKSDPKESTEAHTELFVEASSKFPGSSGDILRPSRPQDSEEKEQKLEDDSNIPHSYTQVEKMEEDMPMENMESQDKEVVDIININGVNSEIINGSEVWNTIDGIEAEKSASEEQEPTLSNSLLNDGRDSRVSQSEALALTKSQDSFQIEAPEPECKYVVLTNNRIMIENGSESKQKRYDSNTTSLSEGLVEESNANKINICQSEFVTIGCDHEEERKEGELCDSYKPMIQNGFQIDDENVPLDVLKLNMQDSNQNSISEISCKELEGETKMVVGDIVPTESIVTDSNHEEGKLPTCLSQPVEKFLPPDPVSLDESQVPKQDRLIETDTVDSRSGSTIASDRNSCDEVDVRKTSNFDSTNSTVETMVSLENEKSKQDLSQNQGLDQSNYQELSTVALVPSGMSTDGSQGHESACDLTNHTCDHNSNFDFGTEENNDHSVNEMNQDNIKGKVDVRAK